MIGIPEPIPLPCEEISFTISLQYILLSLSKFKCQFCFEISMVFLRSKKISNDQELIQSDPTSCPINQKGNN